MVPMVWFYVHLDLYQSTSSLSPKLFLTWRNSIVLSNSPTECTFSSELADVHLCNKMDFPYLLLCVPLYDILAFLVHCCLSIWNQHCLAWKIFPRHASLKDRSPELFEPFVTLDFPISIFCLCGYTLHSCEHPRFAEQINIWSWYFLLPKFTLSSISYFPNCRITRRILSHRNRKNWWRASFQIFSLERIRVPSCNTIQNSVFPLQYQCKWLLLQTLRLLLFWNIGFPYARSLSKILPMRQAKYDLDVMSSEFPSISTRVCYTFRKSLTQQRKFCEIQSMTLTDLCSYRHPNNHKLVFSCNLQICTCWPDEINITKWNRMWFFDRHVQSNFSVQYDDDKKSFRASAWVQKSLLIPSSSFRFFRIKLFPIAMRFSAETLPPYGGFPPHSGFSEFVVSFW